MKAPRPTACPDRGVRLFSDARDVAKLSHTFLDGTRIEAFFWDVETGRATDDPLDANGVLIRVFDKDGRTVVETRERKARARCPTGTG